MKYQQGPFQTEFLAPQVLRFYDAYAKLCFHQMRAYVQAVEQGETHKPVYPWIATYVDGTALVHLGFSHPRLTVQKPEVVRQLAKSYKHYSRLPKIMRMLELGKPDLLRVQKENKKQKKAATKLQRVKEGKDESSQEQKEQKLEQAYQQSIEGRKQAQKHERPSSEGKRQQQGQPQLRQTSQTSLRDQQMKKRKRRSDDETPRQQVFKGQQFE